MTPLDPTVSIKAYPLTLYLEVLNTPLTRSNLITVMLFVLIMIILFYLILRTL
nr:MAG TPA: Rifin [Microviridae sp.]